MTQIICKNNVSYMVKESVDKISTKLEFGNQILLTLANEKTLMLFINHIISVEEK